MILPKGKGGLGFRDLHSFKLAMLSRQAWRLVKYPVNLGGQVLHAKYYPNMDVLEVKAEQGIFYACRSILYGIDLLGQGVILRIGYGTHVRI